jgi:hypothetical protein
LFLTPLGRPNLSASEILAGYLSKKAREVLVGTVLWTLLGLSTIGC